MSAAGAATGTTASGLALALALGTGALALAAFVRAGRDRVTPPPGAPVLVHGRFARAFVWPFVLVPILLAVVAALRPGEVPVWVGPLGILIAASVAVPLRREVETRAVTLDAQGLSSVSAWGGPVRLAWADVDRVKITGKNRDTLVLRGRAGGRVRVNLGMTGLDVLAEMLARHVPTVPDVPRVLKRLPPSRGR